MLPFEQVHLIGAVKDRIPEHEKRKMRESAADRLKRWEEQLRIALLQTNRITWGF